MSSRGQKLTRVLDGVHAEGAKEGDLVTSANSVDLGVGTAVTTGLATEVVLKDLLALGRHVAASVLTDVLPVAADGLAVDLELAESVVAAHSDGQSEDGSSSLHFEGSCEGLLMRKMRKSLKIDLRSTKMETKEG